MTRGAEAEAQTAGGRAGARRLRPDLPFSRPAVVLSGGGALGAYEVGVLRVLEAVGLRPAIVAGVSIGALNLMPIAALVATPVAPLAGVIRMVSGCPSFMSELVTWSFPDLPHPMITGISSKAPNARHTNTMVFIYPIPGLSVTRRFVNSHWRQGGPS